MIIGNYEKFCKNFHLCEGYEKALNSSEDYFLHHIQGEFMSREELKEYDWYYDCHPSCLKWVTTVEHNKIHGRCMRFETRRKKSESQKGKVFSDEHRKNMSESLTGEKNPIFGKKRSDETRRKISESLTGNTPWNKVKVLSDEHKRKLSESRKNMSWKLVNGKRIYSVYK